MKRVPRMIATAALAGVVFASAGPSALAEELLSSQKTEQESTNIPFTDVTPRYKEAVSFMYSNGFAQGISKTQFGVNQPIKRIDAAMTVAKYVSLNPGSNQMPFKDVPQRAVPMVSAIYDAGLMIGKSATLFGSNDPIKRGEAAVLLYQLLPSITPFKTANIAFTDVSERYVTAIEKLVAHGIVQGKTATRFGTADHLTRGE
ncbi:S-layer homology domain-containing protein [Domibacillus robiginosus]|uniref:S-layer homology domain-containing protein n=1 Tax=Domibacillus robiginosus TaxID=1071054 RepID=UPI00067D4DD7|nr:S-layer homology domain-containing protein [Domibacillus robiginosus]